METRSAAMQPSRSPGRHDRRPWSGAAYAKRGIRNMAGAVALVLGLGAVAGCAEERPPCMRDRIRTGTTVPACANVEVPLP